MSFAHVKQWKRHKAKLSCGLIETTKIICERCGIEFPLSIVPGQIVLSKDDRLYLGDDFKAVDCEL